MSKQLTPEQQAISDEFYLMHEPTLRREANEYAKAKTDKALINAGEAYVPPSIFACLESARVRGKWQGYREALEDILNGKEGPGIFMRMIIAKDKPNAA